MIVQINLPGRTFSFVVAGGVVVEAPHGIGVSVGQDASTAVNCYKEKGAQINYHFGSIKEEGEKERDKRSQTVFREGQGRR